jgi:hypothetical protein
MSEHTHDYYDDPPEVVRPSAIEVAHDPVRVTVPVRVVDLADFMRGIGPDVHPEAF